METFTIQSPAAIAIRHSRRSRKRILLVDDDLQILQLFEQMLTQAGYSVVACSGGVAAIEQFRIHSRFDVLLTDFKMPVMNGVQLAKLLTSVSRKLSVLIVSGSTVEEFPMWELWTKSWCFLAKPTNTTVLLKTLDQLCGLIPIRMAESSVMPNRSAGAGH